MFGDSSEEEKAAKIRSFCGKIDKVRSEMCYLKLRNIYDILSF